MTEYEPSMITAAATHQGLAEGFAVGKRFKSARVVRVCDANPVHLGHQAMADGRWRIYAFADAGAAGEDSALSRFGHWLGTSPDSPVVRFTPADGDDDAIFDVKVIYQQTHPEVDINAVPTVFKPTVGPFDLLDYNKVYGVVEGEDIFDIRQIDRGGAVVVVRPDQYVAHLLPLEATADLAAFFAATLRPPAPA